jgi:hypothetical protein
MDLGTVTSNIAPAGAGAGQAAPKSLRGTLKATLGGLDPKKVGESDDSEEYGSYGGGTDSDGGDYHATADDIQDLDAAPDGDAVEQGEPADPEAADSEGGDAEESVDAESAPGSELEVEITDDKGKRSIKVDLADHAKLKRYIQMAAGSQKSAAKYKQELADRDSKLAALTEHATLGEKLAGAWSESGIDGIIRTLTGGKQSWDALYEERAKLEGWKSKATPEQLAAYNAGLDAEKAKREAAEARAALESDRKQSAEAKAAAERAQLQSTLDHSFAQHRFAGKLGDEAREHRLDKQLWAAVRSEIEELPDDAVIDRALVSKLFQEQVQAIRGTIETQVRTETARVVKQKGAEAKSQAQSQMRAATGKPGTKSVSQDIESKGLKGTLRAALIRAAGR